MNIFILSLIVSKCVQYHCDKHVVKMILETAQILCTSHRFLDGSLIIIEKNNRSKKIYKLEDKNMDELLYVGTHINHPCVVWARENSANYDWLFKFFLELCAEYTYRYNKEHLCHKKFASVLNKRPKNITICEDMTPFARAMPDHCKIEDDAVKSYRNYYILEKQHIANWTKRERPEWFIV